MSYSETHIGTLVPITANECDDIIRYMRQKLGKDSIDFANDTDEDIIDEFMEEYYEKYYYDKSKCILYRIDNHKELGEDEDLDIWELQEDNSIKFITQFYNGGCCLDEAIEYGLKKIDKELDKRNSKEEILSEQKEFLDYLNHRYNMVNGEDTKQRIQGLINYVMNYMRVNEKQKNDNMKDFRGTELKIGDHVAVAMCGGSYATYMEEYIVKGSCKRGGYNCLIMDMVNAKYCWDANVVKAEHKVVKIS